MKRTDGWSPAHTARTLARRCDEMGIFSSPDGATSSPRRGHGGYLDRPKSARALAPPSDADRSRGEVSQTGDAA